MPAAIPVIAAFGSAAAAGGVAAGFAAVGAMATASVAGFLTVAGGVLSGIGALTGKKDLMKIGGLMALGGGIGNMLGGAGGAAGAADAAAGAGADATSLASAEGAKSAFGSVMEAAPPPDTFALAGKLGETPGLGEGLGALGPESVAPVDSLVSRAQQFTGARLGVDAAAAGSSTAALDPLAQAGSTMTSNDLNSYLGNAWEKTKAALGGVGDFVKNNKELVSIGGNALASMYGPQAEQMDWQKSIMARRLRNLNAPVVMGPTGG